MGGLLLESMMPTMQWVGDTFQSEFFGARNKYIHTVGNTATIKFVPNANNVYTGVFEGSDHGILRLSTAVKPKVAKKDAAGAMYDFTPGFGLKFLRDGVPSANLVAMHSVDGQPSWNLFGLDFSNHVAEQVQTALKVLSAKFYTATTLIQSVGLSDFAKYGQDGKTVAEPKFPFSLTFEAQSDVKSRFADDFSADFQEHLDSIPAGTNLYKVHAVASPNAEKVYIGDIILTSALVRSYFGDRYLFFKH